MPRPRPCPVPALLGPAWTLQHASCWGLHVPVFEENGLDAAEAPPALYSKSLTVHSAGLRMRASGQGSVHDAPQAAPGLPPVYMQPVRYE